MDFIWTKLVKLWFDVSLQLLTRGQLYVVAVELDMPESPVNQDLGKLFKFFEFLNNFDNANRLKKTFF